MTGRPEESDDEMCQGAGFEIEGTIEAIEGVWARGGDMMSVLVFCARTS